MRGRRSDEASAEALREALRRTAEVADRVARGDLEARLGPLGLGEADAAMEERFRASINAMLDVADAYVRESAAAIVAASEGNFHRRLLEGGLPGVFLNCARIIESGRVAMEAAQDAARSAADARKDLASQLEAALVGLAGDMTTAAAGMRETAVGASSYAREAQADAQKARGTVESLRASTEEIRNAVGLITQIADQTRMLALNATIEAARAGTAGRGFAVVATEVKGLAHESAKSSKTIIEGVTAVKDAAESTIGVLESVTDQIVEMSRRNDEIVSAADGDGDTHGLIPVVERLRTEVNSFVEVIRATERRGARRTPTTRSVSITSDRGSVTGKLRNISLTGVAFEVPRTEAFGAGDTVKITVQSDEGPLECNVNILRMDPIDGDRRYIAARIVYKRPPYERAFESLTREQEALTSA